MNATQPKPMSRETLRDALTHLAARSGLYFDEPVRFRYDSLKGVGYAIVTDHVGDEHINRFTIDETGLVEFRSMRYRPTF